MIVASLSSRPRGGSESPRHRTEGGGLSAARFLFANRKLLRDSVGWDVVNWSRAVRYWQENSLCIERGGSLSALEVAAGGQNGGIALWLAKHDCDVVWSDLRPPSNEIVGLHDRWGATSRISYETIDVLESCGENRFDVVVAKSLMGGLGGPDRLATDARAVDHIHRALHTGGEFWFAENITGTKLHAWLRNKKGWGKDGRGWRYLQPQELDGLTAKFSSSSISTAGTLGLLGRREWQWVALGFLDLAVLDRIGSPRWRYVGFGIAVK